MDPATIVALIGLAVSAVTGIAKAIPDKSDYWRQNRLKELQTLVKEGLTPAEEDQLRSMGLSSTQQAEKEMRSRRADALAQLQGGVTAQDIRALEATDAERAQRARLAIDQEIVKQDIAAKARYRQEQAALMEKQHARSQEQKQAIGTTVNDLMGGISTVATADTISKREGVAQTPSQITEPLGLNEKKQANYSFKDLLGEMSVSSYVYGE